MKQNYETNLSYNNIREMHATFVILMVYDSKNRDRLATPNS